MKFCRQFPSDVMPLVYPLVFVFPLHVSIVGHRRFPLLYVRMMQIRNHVIQHRPIDVREIMDISCAIVGQRVATNGLEMDMHSVLHIAGEPAWESIHTYKFPGNFGEPDDPSPLAQLPAMPEANEEQSWTMPRGGGFCFGLMAGDYNGIHYLSPYARLMGFERDFAHSQLTLALCVRHLPPLDQNKRVILDVAIKGPVYYGSNVNMKYSAQGRGHRFDLYCEDKQRPCLSGSVDSSEPDLEALRDMYSWVTCG
jgi:hypothetical protein